MPKTMVSKLPLVPISWAAAPAAGPRPDAHQAEPEEGAPHMAHAAQHRHEQVFDALGQPKGVGLTVRWKCANSQPDTAASSAASTKMVSL
jgi:hypothetical protein